MYCTAISTTAINITRNLRNSSVMYNRPRNLEKGIGESAARSDSLSNKRETRGILGKIKEKSTKNGLSSYADDSMEKASN